ncbi:hypothetical protein CTheo_7824 [Ceratobasidium theobromae]|uniref:Uncharacterized protein n=1 Tax=Ceratobasidium theobromae TaxID=1582974 RepID=A0A5N5QBG4_9AGAM|nr:hypothetical protein CTheo_7824 [Ceratobasidium theobromae]
MSTPPTARNSNDAFRPRTELAGVVVPVAFDKNVSDVLFRGSARAGGPDELRVESAVSARIAMEGVKLQALGGGLESEGTGVGVPKLLP